MSFYDISYKALEQERVRLNDKLNQIYEDAHQMEGKWHDAVKERDQYKAENKKLKEEVEHLKGIIQDEEDWKLLELEEEWL